MRTCLLLSGQFRNAKSCYPSIKKFILDPIKPDVFLSIWNNPESIKPSGWFGETPSDDSDLDDILDMYSPISIRSDYFDDSPESFLSRESKLLDSRLPNGSKTKTLNVMSMWYKKHSANKLRERWEKTNNFKYDIVISSRFDLFFLEDPKIDRIEENTIRIPVGFDWCQGIGDLFAYGDSPTMSRYFDIFEKLHYYRLFENVPPVPELIHKHHLEKCGFNLERWILKYQLRGANIWECSKGDTQIFL